MTQVWGWGRLIKFIDLVLAGASYSSAGERAAVELQTQSQKFCSGIRSAIFCYPNMGTFGKSAHLYVAKNGTSDARTKFLRPFL